MSYMHPCHQRVHVIHASMSSTHSFYPCINVIDESMTHPCIHNSMSSMHSCHSCIHVIHASMPRKLVGNQTCGRVLCPGYPMNPMHLVQELNVDTLSGCNNQRFTLHSFNCTSHAHPRCLCSPVEHGVSRPDNSIRIRRKMPERLMVFQMQQIQLLHYFNLVR